MRTARLVALSAVAVLVLASGCRPVRQPFHEPVAKADAAQQPASKAPPRRP